MASGMARAGLIAGLVVIVFLLGLLSGYLLLGWKPLPSSQTLTTTMTTIVHETVTSTATLTVTETITHVETETLVRPGATATVEAGGGGVEEVCIARLRGGCADLLLDLIARANESIHVMVYGFTLDELGDALIEARRRGVEVKVLIEAESAGWRGSEHERLMANGVEVRLDSNPDLMHHKVMIVDGAIVVTGSYNWTWSAEKENDENLVVINDPAAAAIYEEEFQRLWSMGVSA